MQILETIAVAFGMFSALPMPQPQWNERNMRYAMCAFPLIGVVCGGAWYAWALVCRALALPVLLRAAGLCLLPVLITGGIHLDGYADTCDALASCADPTKKQAILADPHCGAFAVIRLCSYFIATLGLCTAIEPTPAAALCMGAAFTLERALSGLAVTSFPMAKNTGLAHTFATAADRRRVRGVLAAASLLLSLLLVWWGGALAAGAAWLVFWYYHRTAVRQFGGISGDLAGWFVQKAELWMLAALVAGQYLWGWTL